MQYYVAFRSELGAFALEEFPTKEKADQAYQKIKATAGAKVEVLAPMAFETKEEAKITMAGLLGISMDQTC
jgi:hypothetical protein